MVYCVSIATDCVHTREKEWEMCIFIIILAVPKGLINHVCMFTTRSYSCWSLEVRRCDRQCG